MDPANTSRTLLITTSAGWRFGRELAVLRRYIASDMPLDKHKVLFSVPSQDEPDTACYFNLGFSEDEPAE